ncbi:MAG: pentapeptide repeat-containing protein [Sphingomonas sp.]|nr:pentapeptide repeat-containing protein [Sphingomonas sp.]
MAGIGAALRRVHIWWRDDFLGPLNEAWAATLGKDRRWQLFGVVVATLALVALLDVVAAFVPQEARRWLAKIDIFGPLLFPDKSPEWKDRVQGLLVLLGLPVAFLLWHWRDKNVREQLVEQQRGVDNARRDTSLKEFQEVQLRAAGAIDEKYSEQAREALQIAALHQLRGFLRGEFGEAFKRPAFELLLSGHAAAMDVIGTRAIRDWLDTGPPADQIGGEVEHALEMLHHKLNKVMLERIGIIRDEAVHVFNAGFPLNGRCFDFVELPEQFGFRKNQSLTGVSFVGANLFCVHLEGVDLFEAHLEGAFLRGAHLQGADLFGAHLEGANLSLAHLEGAHLFRAHFEGADLFGAHFEGADLRGTQPESTFLRGGYFDDKTRFAQSWDKLPEAERAAIRDEFRKRGMRHVDDPDPNP